MNVSMTIRGVEIIPPSDSRDAWELAFLIRAALARVGNRLSGDMESIAAWLRRYKLPPTDYLAGVLVQFVLGMECADGVGIFSDDSMDAPRILAKRAKQILGKENPSAFIREQVLYLGGIKEGPRPSDLAMLKGGEQEVCGLDAIVRLENGKRVATVVEVSSLDFTIAIDLGLTQVEMESLVSQLHSGSAQDKKLGDAITEIVKSRTRAPNGPDRNYQRIRRNESKLKRMARRLKSSKERAIPPTGGTMTLTILGEHVLANTSNKPVRHGGITTRNGLVFKPTNMELDESRPTKQQFTNEKAPP